jgi:group I intron endonuclease
VSYGIIYKATGPGRKVYVGQTTKTIQQRKTRHRKDANKNKDDFRFYNAVREYGIDGFVWEQIDTAESREELDRKEIEWIIHYDSTNPDKGYNLRLGGSRGKHNDESRKKMTDWQIGRINSSESNEKRRETLKGRIPYWLIGKKLTPEHIKKVVEANRGKLHASIRGEKNKKSKITEETARNIKIDIQNGMKNSSIAQKYGISRFIVQGIKSGKNWAWLEI